MPKVFLVSLKYITVTWLFKMTKFMWVNFNCPCVQTFSCLIVWLYVCTHSHQIYEILKLKIHKLHEFAICTSSQSGKMKDYN